MTTTDNLNADAITRAHQVATNRVKDQIRSEGRKVSSIDASDLRRRIAALLANDPTIVERAAEDIRRWTLAGVFGKARRSKMLTFVQNTRR